MKRKITSVDDYLGSGCGRCTLFETPECKVHAWQEALRSLRKLALESGLTEAVKWSQPCYTFQGKNVAMIMAFKESAALSFFKGALLRDPQRVLELPGENSHAGRVIRFKSAKQIAKLRPVLETLLAEAIEVERAGREVPPRSSARSAVPDEVLQVFAEDPALEQAFKALTPGRQRGYLIYVSGAKQAKTRTSRILKHRQQILEGKGLHDR
ncbi:MAG: YdeI/OmpD-associated family protein [Planctomycetes bacterium]|nr:YdeI/OmpD-associated family protein [Planctomycetota bacterium]